MRKALGLIFVMALVATPAMAQKVTIDYSHDFDFEAVKTFEYVSTEKSDPTDSIMAGRAISMFKQQLIEGGLKEVSENPDIYVTMHYTSQENKSYNTTSMGYGGYGGFYGGWGGWGMGGMGTSTTTESTYTEGTLIFDAYEPSDKKMVWRGTGTVTVKASPQKQTQQVQKILNKLGKKWQKILAGKGK